MEDGGISVDAPMVAGRKRAVAQQASSGRTHWGSRLGFILAATGSAVGLGNIWKFPYITGENGGGLFVLIYLGAIALVGVPILMAEVLIGRTSQKSPVGAFRLLNRGAGAWVAVGWLGVLSGVAILSYYSVVAGWCVYYVWLSLSGGIAGLTADNAPELFGSLVGSAPLNVGLHALFMAATVGIVIGGVKSGVERASSALMPALLLMLFGLLAYSWNLDGFGDAFRFVFAPDASRLTPEGVLEALGHSFFSLSIGMGAMLTYGSYIRPKDSLVGPSIAVGFLDTVVSLVACLVIFPVIFTFSMAPAAGPGLVFKSLPVAFAQLPGGSTIALVFFVLLGFAAVTSGISLLEVGASYLIDERRFSRRNATLTMGWLTFLVGVPSALSGGAFFGARFEEMTGRSWFDWFDYVTSNIMLPLGGLGIALFVAWKVDPRAARDAFASGSRLGRIGWFFAGWLLLLRFIVPVAIVLIFLHSIGVL